MQLFIDDRKIDDEFVHEGTLEDAVRHVQEHVCSPGRLVVGLRCNGRQLSTQAMAEALQKPAPSFDRLDVFTSTRDGLVTDAMKQASASLEATEDVYDQVAELLIQGQISEAVRSLGECLKVWQQIHDAVAKSIQLLGLDPDSIRIRDGSLAEAIGKPKDVLVQVRDALQAQDHVLLADILQYEFADVTQTWHSIVTRVQRAAEEAAEATGRS
jgi:flavin-binding protein dodecin